MTYDYDFKSCGVSRKNELYGFSGRGNLPIYDLAEELIGEKEKCKFLVETISYALKMRTQTPNNKTIIIFVKHSNIYRLMTKHINKY